jgi:sugar phosphate isomerase/epimerase
MRTCGDWPVSVCSWSLRSDVAGVAEVMRRLDIGQVNLAVLPALEKDGKAYLDAVRRQKWTISATMINFPGEDYTTLETIRHTGGIVPDKTWEENRKLALGAIDVTAQLGVELLLMHFGFLDHADAAHARKFADRARLLADAAAAKKVKFLMETGQETAEDLRHFLEQTKHPALTVNLDPANMILYDKGVPAKAVKTLAPWIRHVHAKDATRTKTPGTWGAEVPWGDGEVNVATFLKTLKEAGFRGALAIEREAGDDRAGDIAKAAERLAAAKV